MEKIYKYGFQVRGYELDSFGHVNNAVYINYLEQARWEIMKELGLLEYFKESGNFLVVVETYIKYIGELKLFDKALIETKMSCEGYFIVFKQKISMEGDSGKISKATVKCVLVDKKRNPLDIPDLIKKNV